MFDSYMKGQEQRTPLFFKSYRYYVHKWWCTVEFAIIVLTVMAVPLVIVLQALFTSVKKREKLKNDGDAAVTAIGKAELPCKTANPEPGTARDIAEDDMMQAEMEAALCAKQVREEDEAKKAYDAEVETALRAKKRKVDEIKPLSVQNGGAKSTPTDTTAATAENKDKKDKEKKPDAAMPVTAVEKEKRKSVMEAANKKDVEKGKEKTVDESKPSSATKHGTATKNKSKEEAKTISEAPSKQLGGGADASKPGAAAVDGTVVMMGPTVAQSMYIPGGVGPEGGAMSMYIPKKK